MPKFSQRAGYTLVENAFQRESVDSNLRTKLWNILKITIWDSYKADQRSYDDTTRRIDQLVKRLWFNYFNNDLDRLPDFRNYRSTEGAYEIFKKYFHHCEWYEVFDFLEEINLDPSRLLHDKTRKWINLELETHNSAYRFIGQNIAEITDTNEITSIEEALTATDSAVKTHIQSSLRMLSDKEAPDYRNSVKESISAVEAMCRLITKNPSATLGEALKKVKNLHPAMSRAFSQIYGYTNDSSGIRHSLTDEATISYADAKFMLVACSAFVSYLKVTATD
ncbi:AbiJ-NTD4 domain-containing protein [Massilia oculi]|uniref:AbiJ-NTD4 domain-containing protein n=1 Tax=Massilia oculi TaxID=945844 RepID=UPI0028A7792D|nr:hypothetical protein [Massilia oculi]